MSAGGVGLTLSERGVFVAVRAAGTLTHQEIAGGTSLWAALEGERRVDEALSVARSLERRGLLVWGPMLGFRITPEGQRALASGAAP